MARKRMSVKEERQTARALEKSLKSTADGLAMMLKALERGGFRQAILPYQQMQHVLIQQRLWAVDYKRRELDPHWQAIAEQAAAIHAILAPFAAVMGELKDLNRITPSAEAPSEPGPDSARPDPQTEPSSPEQAALTEQVAALLLDDMTVSGVRLARDLEGDTKERRARLRRLIAAGVVERQGWGRGQRLEAQLITLLQAPPRGNDA